MTNPVNVCGQRTSGSGQPAWSGASPLTAGLRGSRQPMVGAGWGPALGLALIREDRRCGIVGYTNRQLPPTQRHEWVQEQKEKTMIRSLTRLEGRNRLRMLLALLAVAAA